MRPRKKDRHLPACVFSKNGGFYYVKKGKWTKLGNDLNTALAEYSRIVALPSGGLASIINKALPHITSKVAPSTKKQYIEMARKLQHIFAEFNAGEVTHGDIVQMLDAYADQPAVGNRLLTVMRLTYQWAMDRELVTTNPCLSVKRLKQASRDRLISAQEYLSIYQWCNPWMQVIMDMCYLTGQRIGDVLKIERRHLADDGIYFEQQKSGKRLIIGWTPDLRAVVERAKAAPAGVSAIQYLMAGKGGKIRAHTNVWKAFKLAAKKAGVANVTLHDLRAMSGTDSDNQGIDAMKLLGHSDRRTTEIYLRDRAPKVVSGPRKKAG